MAKLTSEQRKNLPDDVFGIPEDKAYPMPDESHVRSAITYFHACPQGKKKKLATNINRMAKKYKMKIKLKPHSPFKPYADKDILEESAELITEGFSLPEDVKKIITREGFVCNPNTTVRTFDEYHREVKYQDNNPRNGIYPVTGEKISSAINIAIRNAAKNYLDKEYLLNGGKERTKIGDFVYDSDLNMCYDITRNFVYGHSVDDPEVLRQCSCIHDKTMLKNAFNEVNKYTTSPAVNGIVDRMNQYIDSSTTNDIMGIIDKKLQYSRWPFAYVMGGEIQFARPASFRNFTEEEINQIEENKRVIDDLGQLTLQTLCNKFHFPLWKDGIGFDAVIMGMEKKGIIDGYYIAGDRAEMSNAMFRFYVKMKKITYLPIHMWNKDGVCIVTMIKIFDNDTHPNYFTTILDQFARNRYKKLPKMPIRKITLQGNHTDQGLLGHPALEGVHISKDGNIRFYFDISTSYMDKYSMIHKAMKEDAANNNISALKHDLAYLFAMIASIEAQFIRKDVDEGTPEYKDALKARMFAKNDFKKYMKVVQKEDSRFNFMQFYMENSYDKEVYTIYTEDIVGIKNLLRKILM